MKIAENANKFVLNNKFDSAAITTFHRNLCKFERTHMQNVVMGHVDRLAKTCCDLPRSPVTCRN